MTGETRTTYTVTDDSKRLDRIAKELYGNEGNGAMEMLFEANRRLAGTMRNVDGEVAFGTILAVPAPTEPEEVTTRPWE